MEPLGFLAMSRKLLLRSLLSSMMLFWSVKWGSKVAEENYVNSATKFPHSWLFLWLLNKGTPPYNKYNTVRTTNFLILAGLRSYNKQPVVRYKQRLTVFLFMPPMVFYSKETLTCDQLGGMELLKYGNLWRPKKVWYVQWWIFILYKYQA